MDKVSHVDLRLPGILEQIADVAGLEAALLVAKEKGGTIAYIPQPSRLSDTHWLAELVGIDAAHRISEIVGGGHIKVPLGPFGAQREQWATIHRLLSANWSTAQIVRAVGVDERTVRRHRSGEAGQKFLEQSQFIEDLRQPDMFSALEN